MEPDVVGELHSGHSEICDTGFRSSLELSWLAGWSLRRLGSVSLLKTMRVGAEVASRTTRPRSHVLPASAKD